MIRLSTPVAALAIVSATVAVTFAALTVGKSLGEGDASPSSASVAGRAVTPTQTAIALARSPSPSVTLRPQRATATAQPTPSLGSLPALPAGWPETLELGVADGLGGAAAMQAGPPYRFRYQYLSGGAGTGWTKWEPDGAFVSSYVAESARYGIVPVFTYYMALQSEPHAGVDGGIANLQDTAAMTAYYADLKLFFQRAGASRGVTTVLHVEPDLWGFIEGRTRTGDASTVPVQVGATGVPELAGMPDTAAGFAQAFKRLRDLYAPNVLLAYHLSVWGTGIDVTYADPDIEQVGRLAVAAAAFYESLGADFDLVFGEFSDRDAGFKEAVYHDGGASWWSAADFARNVHFLRVFVGEARERVVMWQIPLGNTKMRSMDNTNNHYQDNRVEWLLDDPSRSHLDEYRRAGVVAFLFGRGADGATCSCDANQDGVTNPAAINGNTRESTDAADDGGYFHERARAYYAAGAFSLIDP